MTRTCIHIYSTYLRNRRAMGAVLSVAQPMMVMLPLLFCVAAAIPASTQSVSFTSLYSFCAIERTCPGGFAPHSQLLKATDGSFYGTSSLGGEAPNCYGRGCGAIFRISPAGAMTAFYSFCADPGCREGSGPTSGLIQAMDGNFYGTTSGGGANGFGTIFKI